MENVYMVAKKEDWFLNLNIYYLLKIYTFIIIIIL